MIELRIKCDQEYWADASKLVAVELDDFKKYDKIGFGWTSGNYQSGPRFFVRRIKNGLSICQLGIPHEGTADET